MRYNQVVSEVSSVIDLYSLSRNVLITIKPMANANFRMTSGGCLGPIKITIDFSVKKEGDITCFIDKVKDPSEEQFMWKFKNKQSMIIYPKRAFD
jgi:hypothetical protein